VIQGTRYSIPIAKSNISYNSAAVTATKKEAASGLAVAERKAVHFDLVLFQARVKEWLFAHLPYIKCIRLGSVSSVTSHVKGVTCVQVSMNLRRRANSHDLSYMPSASLLRSRCSVWQ